MKDIIAALHVALSAVVVPVPPSNCQWPTNPGKGASTAQVAAVPGLRWHPQGSGPPCRQQSWSVRFRSAILLLRSSVRRVRRRGQYQLIKREIQPSAKLETGLPNRAAIAKSQTLVQADADRIGGVNTSYEYVITLTLGRSDDLLQHTLPNPSPAKARIDIN